MLEISIHKVSSLFTHTFHLTYRQGTKRRVQVCLKMWVKRIHQVFGTEADFELYCRVYRVPTRSHSYGYGYYLAEPYTLPGLPRAQDWPWNVLNWKSL